MIPGVNTGGGGFSGSSSSGVNDQTSQRFAGGHINFGSYGANGSSNQQLITNLGLLAVVAFIAYKVL